MVNDTVNANRTFKITVNQMADVKWLINGTEVFNESSVTTSSYTNTKFNCRNMECKLGSIKLQGSVMSTWVWTVTGEQIPDNADKMLKEGKISSALILSAMKNSGEILSSYIRALPCISKNRTGSGLEGRCGCTSAISY